jgi:hypothetical protein
VLVDIAGVATCNDEVADSMRDADADVIAAGREPRERSPRLSGLVRLLVVAQTLALAVAVAVAVHYRTEAAGLRQDSPSAAGLPVSPLPEVTSVSLRLLDGGSVAGTVVITAAALPDAGRAQFPVSAVITGAVPGTVYDLIGSDCSIANPVPDDVWATGLAGANGTADLIGYAWTGAVADRYWMALNPSSVNSPPGLDGQFAEGRAVPFPAGQAPCAESSAARR